MITTLTRVPIDNLDDFIADEEVVLALTEQFGFDTSEILNLAADPETIDPMALFQTMEERWNGHGQTFSLENQLPLLNYLLKTYYSNTPLEILADGGYPTPIFTENGPIKIFLPDPVKKISKSLNNLTMKALQAHANVESIILSDEITLNQQEIITAPLWQLYEGLVTFFKNASAENHYILKSFHKLSNI